jgi:hypothetical protein
MAAAAAAAAAALRDCKLSRPPEVDLLGKAAFFTALASATTLSLELDRLGKVALTALLSCWMDSCPELDRLGKVALTTDFLSGVKSPVEQGRLGILGGSGLCLWPLIKSGREGCRFCMGLGLSKWVEGWSRSGLLLLAVVAELVLEVLELV